jgi:DNA-binding MarR family transcriptional regulator
MEAEDLIVRVGDPNDGRNSLVSLTKSGKALLYKAYQDYELLVEEMMGRFKPEEIEQYNRDIQFVQNTLRPQALSEPEGTFRPVLLLRAQGEDN